MGSLSPPTSAFVWIAGLIRLLKRGFNKMGLHIQSLLYCIFFEFVKLGILKTMKKSCEKYAAL
jgi:hypothetical protein